jgi:sterol desaturase/sphingolipid hydroxylase (fatty acid hydroxylase superfamily)
MNFIIGYYIFNLQQYIIHKIQHTKYFQKHRHNHHQTYDRGNITTLLKSNSLYQNIDLYFYGNIVCLFMNIFIFDQYICVFQLFLAYLSYYFHNEYHNPVSIWKKYDFYNYLQTKHQLHHQYPNKNHFLLDPTFDIFFGTYI